MSKVPENEKHHPLHEEETHDGHIVSPLLQSET